MYLTCLFLLNIPDLLQFHTPTLRHSRRTQEEQRLEERSRNQWAAAEHVAQSNQYFLATAGTGVRNKPSLTNHLEFHSQTLGDAADFKISRNKESNSLNVDPETVWSPTDLLTDFFFFFWRDLLGASPLLLHHLLLLHAALPWCCYYCDIFLPSIPEVIWLLKIAPPPPSPIMVVLFDFLSGWLQSLTPCPCSATLATKNPH